MKQLINKIEESHITSTNELIKLVTRELEQEEYKLAKNKGI